MPTPSPQPVPKRKRKPREGAFSRDDWLNLARKELIKNGIDQVKVERLSKISGVTRSSFYWHFRNRQDLLDALLDHWEAANTGPLLRAIDAARAEGPQGIYRIGKLWLDEKEFSPAYDTAVRDWARKETKVGKVVAAIDARRIAAFTQLMASYGHAGEEALVRARIIYFHQVGYYALGLRESHGDRVHLLPVYMRALTGLDL